MKSQIYFAATGITQTQAAFIKNMCKEASEQAQARLNGINIENATIALIDSQTSSQISKGVEDISFVKEDIEFISQAASLGAWLGEAIKAKEEILMHTDNVLTNIDLFVQTTGKSFPEKPYLRKYISENDVLSAMGKDFVCKYLSLEAVASQYGKAVHPDGSISKMRKKANDIINKPSIASGSGRDLTITNRSISVGSDSIENLFFEMQNVQRIAQGELNKMKAEIKEEIKKLDLEEISKSEKSTREYNIAIDQLNKERDVWHVKEKARVSALKISIPEPLQEFYNKINAMIG